MSDAERPLDLVGTEGIRLSFGRAQIYLATPSCRISLRPHAPCLGLLVVTVNDVSKQVVCFPGTGKLGKLHLSFQHRQKGEGVLFVVVFVFLGIGKVRQGTTPSTALHAERFTADGVQCHNRN